MGTRIMCRSFCANARDGLGHADQVEKIPEALRDKTALSMPDGEIICVQTNARKDGELFSNMFYMREVELDDDTFILGLQCEMPDDVGHALDDVNRCFPTSSGTLVLCADSSVEARNLNGCMAAPRRTLVEHVPAAPPSHVPDAFPCFLWACHVGPKLAPFKSFF